MSGKPAARLGDPTACPKTGHGTNPIAAGSPDVLFDGLPAARMGDASACGGAMASAVIPNVLIDGKPAAVVGSVGNHGNVVTAGSGTVVIGSSGGGAAFSAPSPVDLSDSGVFDAHFIVRDATTGSPIANQPYQLHTASGQVVSGSTDQDGRTALIRSDKAEAVTLKLPPQAVLVLE
ncbi:PAAR domain-containing protein [Stutzerimonas frequens]|uniref:PAAR domain-containing protein n=1 Tax=Stutzerimonas frequens TaxID=2968969 RepID=UPI0029348529|nr:PAAR domain-containing protein [Stutzerimonas frequens]WOC79730.1 PAAR domain-containing protein [Stutzerimonas frequens]